jgi:hypothetical protein
MFLGIYVFDSPCSIPIAIQKFIEIGLADADGPTQAVNRKITAGNQTTKLAIRKAEVVGHLIDGHQT